MMITPTTAMRKYSHLFMTFCLLVGAARAAQVYTKMVWDEDLRAFRIKRTVRRRLEACENHDKEDCLDRTCLAIKLYKAADTGDYSKVKYLIGKIPVPDRKEFVDRMHYAYTPIHAAADGRRGEALYRGKWYPAEFITKGDKGYQVRVYKDKPPTEILVKDNEFRISIGYIAVVNFLIRAVADVNHRIDEQGYTPLYLAIQNRHTNVINALIGCTRTNVNLATKDGCTPLYAAAQCGLPEVVKALIRAGADVNHLYDGFTPLDIAEQRRNTESSKPYNKADKNRMFYSGPHAQVVKILKYAVAKRTQDPKWFYSKSDRSKCNVKICQIKA